MRDSLPPLSRRSRLHPDGVATVEGDGTACGRPEVAATPATVVSLVEALSAVNALIARLRSGYCPHEQRGRR